MSIRERLSRLESGATLVSTTCTTCGANWPGSVYRVAGVNPTEHRCVRCGELRPAPAFPAKAVQRGLMEAL